MAQSIRSSQKDYITILGIFAAVVMVFFSGVGFSSSVLANIHQASIYRIWIGITLLGAVLFNSLWVLFNFLREVIDKRQERWKIFKVANSLLAVSIISALICAHYGWFEAIQNGKQKSGLEMALCQIKSAFCFCLFCYCPHDRSNGDRCPSVSLPILDCFLPFHLFGVFLQGCLGSFQ